MNWAWKLFPWLVVIGALVKMAKENPCRVRRGSNRAECVKVRYL